MSTKVVELKVGIFIMIAMMIFIIIIFSIGDIHITRAGYRINAVFNFVSGIGESAPVRLAGVKAGQVERIDIVYEEKKQKPKAMIHAWIREDVQIEDDAEFTINTLGLLGEKYLEIKPGTPGRPLLKNGSTITGHDPVSMEQVTENLASLANSVKSVVQRLERGEGTVGKLLTEDAVYNDLKETMGNLKDFTAKIKLQGGVGRALFDESAITDFNATAGNFKEFSEDIKRHPWKLLSKPRGE